MRFDRALELTCFQTAVAMAVPTAFPISARRRTKAVTVARSANGEEVSLKIATSHRRSLLTLVRDRTLGEELGGGGGNSSSHTLENLGHDNEEGRATAMRE